MSVLRQQPDRCCSDFFILALKLLSNQRLQRRLIRLDVQQVPLRSRRRTMIGVFDSASHSPISGKASGPAALIISEAFR